MEAVKQFYRDHTVWSWVIIVVVGLVVIGALAPAEEEDGSGESSQQAVEQPAEEGTPEPAPSPQDDVRAALDDAEGPVEDPEIKDVTFGNSEIQITAETPEGGFEGPSAEDMDRLTGAILAAVYGDAEWDKTGTEVVFQGGLVNTKTGQDEPDANTAIYTISRGEANQIDWSDDDAIDYTIDWSLYRDFLHPAFD